MLLPAILFTMVVTMLFPPPAEACYTCTRAGRKAWCDSGFFAGSRDCHRTTRPGLHGRLEEDCEESGNCGLWIISLDTVGLPSQGSEQSTDGTGDGLGSDDELVPLTWVCADDLVVDSTGPAGEASR